ncbi:MAG: serine--tRNA ligase [Pseudomonadota bacterium]
MHDIRFIRETPDLFDAKMARRGLSGVSGEVLGIDARRREAITKAEQAQAERNAASKDVGKAKAAGDEAAFERLRALVSAKKDEIAALEEEAKALDEALTTQLMSLPNLPADDIPDGEDEADNVEIRRWGEPRQIEGAKEHFDLVAPYAGMDFEVAAKLSGARFVVLQGAVARLHRALAQFMIDLHTAEHGLTEVWTPALVNDATLLGTGQLPKFEEDLYQLREGKWLIPTSEVTLTNLVAGEIVEETSLPRRYTAHTQCFRSEAGSAGKDTRGMLRQHQFEKVEMVSITRPEEGRDELERMTRCAETVLERLGLPYRTIVLCTGDMGFGAVRTHDIEVWVPGQGTYREISSCSLCDQFQARRMNARFRRGAEGKPEFVATLNGSGLAVGRCLIAVLENGQQPDGAIALPEALSPYLGGATVLTADGVLA